MNGGSIFSPWIWRENQRGGANWFFLQGNQIP